MKKAFLLLVLSLLLLPSCSEQSRGLKPESAKDIRYTEAVTDTITFRVEDSSTAGLSGVQGDSLFFFDKYFAYLYSISVDGEVGSRRMGLGNGPGEIQTRSPLAVCVNSQNPEEILFLGGSYDAYSYLDGQVRRMDMSPGNAPVSYESPSSYTLWDQVLFLGNEKSLYYNVLGNADEVSIWEQVDYFQQAAAFMKVDRVSGKMTPVGNYPDSYVLDPKHYKMVPRAYMDLDGEDTFYVTYQADSLIYELDADFATKTVFGFQGKDMDTDYEEFSNDQEQMGRALMKNQEEKGYYNWIKKVNGLLFRSYQKSAASDYDGLQIYEGRVLIGDVKIPRGMKVVGYVAPYYISSIVCDEDTETMWFYRFKLK